MSADLLRAVIYHLWSATLKLADPGMWGCFSEARAVDRILV